MMQWKNGAKGTTGGSMSLNFRFRHCPPQKVMDDLHVKD